MEIGSLTSVVAVALSLLALLFGAFRYITAMGEAIRREIVSTHESARLTAEKGDEAEARQRHAMANSMQTLIAKLDSDVRTLQREAVRQEQMNALETRIANALGKIETKVDRLAETAGELGAIKSTLTSLAQAVERLNQRLDAMGQRRMNSGE